MVIKMKKQFKFIFVIFITCSSLFFTANSFGGAVCSLGSSSRGLNNEQARNLFERLAREYNNPDSQNGDINVIIGLLEYDHDHQFVYDQVMNIEEGGFGNYLIFYLLLRLSDCEGFLDGFINSVFENNEVTERELYYRMFERLGGVDSRREFFNQVV